MSNADPVDFAADKASLDYNRYNNTSTVNQGGNFITEIEICKAVA